MNFDEIFQKAASNDLQSIVENDPIQKIRLRAESAKNYICASELSTDPGVKITLAYLAAFKLSEAELQTSVVDLKPNKNAALNFKGNSARHSKATLLGNRLLLAAHTKRINSLNKIPKPQALSNEDIVNDILAMEKKLYSLGIEKNKSEPTNNMMESRHLSDLGESFMMLSNHPSTQPTNDRTHPNQLNTDAKVNSLSMEKDSTTKKPKRVPSRVAFTAECDVPHRKDTNSTKQLTSMDTTIAHESNIILPLGGYVGSEGSSGRHLEAVDWNVKSVILSDQDPTTDTAPISSKSAITRSSSSSLHLQRDLVSKPSSANGVTKPSLSRSSSAPSPQPPSSTPPGSLFGSDGLPNIQNPEESIMRLLSTIDTLHKENTSLQQEHEQILQNMHSFEQEYKAKFLYLKQYLQRTPLAAMVTSPKPTNPEKPVENNTLQRPNANNNNANLMPSAREVELLQQCNHWKQVAESWEKKYRKAQEDSSKKLDQMKEYEEFFAEFKRRKEQKEQQHRMTSSSSLSSSSSSSSSSENKLHHPHSQTHGTGVSTSQMKSGGAMLGRSSGGGGGAGGASAGSATTSGAGNGSAVPHSMNMATMQAHIRQMQQGRSSRHHTTSTLESLHKSTTSNK